MIEGISFKISGSFKGPFDEISRQMPEIEKKALYAGAFFLRDCIRKSIISNIPKATVRNPKYNDTLADAPRFTKPDGSSLTVHALGSGATGSGTFRARFFEAGTKDRYQKTYRGEPLKKKRYVGRIGPTHFFSSAVEANRAGVLQRMEAVLTKYVDTAFKNKI